jgi:hypothetical protein
MNRLSFIFLSLGCLTNAAFAQADRAILSGTVTDASGAAIAVARVTLTDPATGLLCDAVTAAAGLYSTI